jgi:hypothetical protein
MSVRIHKLRELVESIYKNAETETPLESALIGVQDTPVCGLCSQGSQSGEAV